MEVYRSKTLKTSNLKLKLKNLRRSCDESDARIKVCGWIGKDLE
jgi:hypothetical protein